MAWKCLQNTDDHLEGIPKAYEIKKLNRHSLYIIRRADGLINIWYQSVLSNYLWPDFLTTTSPLSSDTGTCFEGINGVRRQVSFENQSDANPFGNLRPYHGISDAIS